MKKPGIKYFSLIVGLLASAGMAAAGDVYWMAGRILGQPGPLPLLPGTKMSPPSSAPNLVEGREFNSPISVAIDTQLSPPAVYAVDLLNHRVLGWRDSATFASGSKADLVLGQPDLTSTQRLANSSSKVGLYLPTSVAVDQSGNVFVYDAGLNRILRYPRPFDDAAPAVRVPDLLIGQLNLASASANQSTSTTAAPSASTIKTCCFSGTSTGMYFVGWPTLSVDPKGNLWASDPGNHRILRYKSSDVSGGTNLDGDGIATTVISADLVLGQLDFVSAKANQGRADTSKYADRLDRTSIRFGGPVAFDAAGNLYFADDLDRVMVWKSQSQRTGASADGLLGLWAPATLTALPSVNEYFFGFPGFTGTTALPVWAGGPHGLFCVGNNLYVVDSYNNRIVGYDPISTWTNAATGIYSVRMKTVSGQKDFNTGEANGYALVEPSANAYSFPTAAAYSNGEVFISDMRNHRVLVQPLLGETNSLGAATRVLGQYQMWLRSPNLTEGREFGGYLSSITVGSKSYSVPIGPKAALDCSVSPPRLYVADTLNNRVLCFLNARNVKNGDPADLVLGQVDPERTFINSPSNDPNNPTLTGLYQPAGIYVDGEGNVWVADTGNARVLRFPNPFTRTDGALTPDLVLGAPNYTSPIVEKASRDRFRNPTGIAMTSTGDLVVVDPGFDRVTVMHPPFGDGQAADLVLGQKDGSAMATGNGDWQLSTPFAVALDAQDDLYVADPGNQRVLIFSSVNQLSDGASATFSIPGVLPMGVAVSPSTGQVWIADPYAQTTSTTGVINHNIRRYPNLTDMLLAGSAAVQFHMAAYGAHSVLLDEEASSVVVLDSANRINFHYPKMSIVNGISGFTHNAANGHSTIAPGSIAQLDVSGLTIAPQSESASGTPLPTVLADLMLTIDGATVPLLGAAGNSLRFIVPKETRVTQDPERVPVVLSRVSSGEVLSFGSVAHRRYGALCDVLRAGQRPSF